MLKTLTRPALIAASLLIAAPFAQAEDAGPETAVAAFFDALSAKEFDEVETMFAEGAVVVLPYAAGQGTVAAPAVFNGVEQLMGYYRGAGQRIAEVGFDGVEVTVSADGGTVFVENVGDMVLPDGRDYENRYVWRFTVEDGLFTEVREYFDPKVADVAFGRN